MGLVKREWEESIDRGWAAPEAFVCAACVGDTYLKEIINENLSSRKCSYCGKGSRGYIAAPVEAIMPAISSGLYYYFNDPDSAGVPYDGGYVFESNTTTEDALQRISLECHDDLFADVAASFHNALWIETAGGHWASTHLSDSMAYAWRNFVRTIKHQCRYFFSTIPTTNIYSPEELSPSALLGALGSMVSNLELTRVLPLDSHLFRVRIREVGATWLLSFAELGPPPNEKAKAGRMNPAGISYFYLAQDMQTAFAEVVSKPPCNVVVADFKTTTSLLLLDLCNLPRIPSVFDQENHEGRELIYFLIQFINEITQPVAKNGQEHIDYVASQIVSEFFAREFCMPDGRHLNGFAYPSAIHPGGINIVLFPPLDVAKKFNDLAELSSSREAGFKTWDDFFKMLR